MLRIDWSLVIHINVFCKIPKTAKESLHLHATYFLVYKAEWQEGKWLMCSNLKMLRWNICYGKHIQPLAVLMLVFHTTIWAWKIRKWVYRTEIKYIQWMILAMDQQNYILNLLIQIWTILLLKRTYIPVEDHYKKLELEIAYTCGPTKCK